MSASKIIDYLLKFRPTAQWIKDESKLPYLPLDLKIPVDKIFQEWQQVKNQAVIHRGSDKYGSLENVGWKSLTLYGLDKHETQATGDNMNWTDVAIQCPNTVQWLTSNFIIGPKTGRIRFMLLEPGGFIVLHNDRVSTKLSEINIAITNPVGCVFRFKNQGTVPFAPGVACLMDTSYEHFVINRSNEPRLHLIVHSKLNNEDVIAQSYANRYYN